MSLIRIRIADYYYYQFAVPFLEQIMIDIIFITEKKFRKRLEISSQINGSLMRN